MDPVAGYVNFALSSSTIHKSPNTIRSKVTTLPDRLQHPPAMADGYTALEAEKTAMRIATELVTRGQYDCMQQFKDDISKRHFQDYTVW